MASVGQPYGVAANQTRKEKAMDPFRTCVALGPLSIYLLLLAWINLARRPFLVSGARDTAALGVGVAGLLLIGPIELFLPQEAMNTYRPIVVWLLLLTMYGLCLSLAVLLTRPRLTIYNILPEQIRPLLAEVIERVDSDARWAGNSLVLPHLNVELHLEISPLMRNVSLVANGDLQSYAGWRYLERALAGRLRTAEVAPNVWGVTLVLISATMMTALGWQLMRHTQAITQGFHEMLRL